MLLGRLRAILVMKRALHLKLLQADSSVNILLLPLRGPKKHRTENNHVEYKSTAKGLEMPAEDWSNTQVFKFQ